ncbi:single-strand binding protein [Caldanaerobius fijiensis DSM 17918]|uniref:Single-stranded DNA-binding protein n=1 Tax=Caldanaerobius fijiensis DSM 17918 TaxID=1121256 RepID=A0A1M5F8H2_9THEO|nr:single-stranded DNA-binding protein [Caldanaerobius fijiensis]SHF87776.1 single-strand binding protein [Caldanaerobius fijiensis DSM 17918]
MNKVFLIGRLTNDPTERKTQNGKTVDSFTLAVDRPFANANGERETDFIPIVVWGKSAELVSKYCKKGKQVAVCGRLQTRSYEKDGTKRYVTEVVADEVQFLANAKGSSAKNADKNDNDSKGYDEEDIEGFVPVDMDESELPF